MEQQSIQYNIKVGFYKSDDKEEELEFIYPNPKPEEETIDLGFLDQRQPNVWVPITIVIDNKEGKLTYDSLKSGLEKALGQYPYFSGRLMEGRYVKFDNAWFGSSNSTNTDFKVDDNFNLVPFEFQFKKAIDALIESDSKPAPLFAAKATFIKDNCVVLTTLTSHFIGDGQTISDFIRLWAKHTSTKETIPLKPIIKPDPVSTKQKPLGLPEFSVESLSMLSIKISLEKLKNVQLEANRYATTKFVSKEDIFLAMLWRILFRARQTTSDTIMIRAMSIHSRKDYNVGLGNKYVMVGTNFISNEDLMSKPIEEVAQFIRAGIPSKDSKLPPELFAEFDPTLIDLEKVVGATSHRMFYDPPLYFNHQPSFVQAHLTFPNGIIIQPTDHEVMFATLCIHNNLVPRILSDPEVSSYGIDITINPIN